MDWTQFYLFMLVFMRITGFVVLTPLLGRNAVPGIVKAGLIITLSVFVVGSVGESVPAPQSDLALMVTLLLEMGVGLVLGMLMRFTFSVVQTGGEIIDAQMGITMAQIYDAGSQANMSVTASLLNVMLMLDFFAENGHYTLLRILLASGDLIPYGTASFGEGVANYGAEVFLSCMLLSVKLAMPILAAELLGEISMGILMKAIPQINAFVINMELKVLIGLVLLFLFLTPINEFLLEIESAMLDEAANALRIIGAGG
mgnify:CR=1 FL=1